jgi:hypothetical protein
MFFLTSYLCRHITYHYNVKVKVKVNVKVKVKVKFTLEQAKKTQRGNRDIALLIL